MKTTIMLNRKMLIQLENSIFESLKKRVNAKIQFFKVCTDLRKSKRAVGKMATIILIQRITNQFSDLL